MKQSQLFTKTRKEAPKDEVAKNAQLLIRAGFIHKEMAGVYGYLPLGLRVLEKIKQIVREEMNAIGAQEIIMTTLQSKELWESTDRWDDDKVDVWFKSKLHAGGEVGFGWSHEEPISSMMKDHISSFRDLPVRVHQFQNKLRNEVRAKSGIMRGREFGMNDMYSFDADKESNEAFYEASIDAYKRVFDRVGIGSDTYVTYASGGAFTKFSHEFQTLCDAGEDVLFKVPSTGDFYNSEIAPSQAPAIDDSDEEMKEREDVKGEGIIGVEELAKFFKIPVEKTTKTILFLADKERIVAAAVRGGYDISEVKLKNVLDCETLELLSEEMVREVTGAEVGYAGLLDLPENVETYWDESTKNRKNFEMGANKTDYHSININFGRDVEEPKEFFDFKEVKEGDMDPETGEVYEVEKAAEVGNIFNFGTIKCEQLGLTYKDESGKSIPVWLSSYGIGFTRLMGVIVEKLSDDKGMVWPESVAPFTYHIVDLSSGDEAVKKRADDLYEAMTNRGIEVLYDDRDARAGEKFADSDLIGIPYRIVVSAKNSDDALEVVRRATSETLTMSRDELLG